MLNDLGILKALGKSESTIVLINDEAVIKLGKLGKLLADDEEVN